jgi:uncharacterized protein (TIGR02996 family)
VDTRRAFLEAILADPEEDGPRLVYADWLDEQGEAGRAEFIRVQCARSLLPAEDPRRDELARREAELFAEQGEAWSAGGPRGEGWQHPKAWARGFPRHLPVFTQELHAQVDARLASGLAFNALTLELNLDHSDPAVNDLAWVDHLADSPRLRLVTELLGANSGFGPRRFAALFRSPHLTRLASIDLFEDVLGVEGLRALVASPSPFRLAGLTLNAAMSYQDGESDEVRECVALLASSPRFAGLADLRLYYNGIPEAALETLIASQHLSPTLTLEFEEGEWEPPEELAERLRERFPGP